MSKICNELHRLFNNIPRRSFPNGFSNLPSNGIYILFEQGETGHNTDRIVRIGTHTGKDQLASRLKQHFVTENKDRSIFRKNIGRAILNGDKDPFLAEWEIDLTTKKARELHEKRIDTAKQLSIEEKVSNHIRRNLSFVTFHEPDKKTRLDLESRIISTVSWCKECGPSKSWLGRYSPKSKIRESGLWLVNGLYKSSLSQEETNYIRSRL